VRAAAADHLLNDEALKPGVRPGPLHTLGHRLGGSLDLFRPIEIEDDPAYVRLVRDVGREDLERDAATDVSRLRCRLSR
jgi:hypothetical protein